MGETTWLLLVHQIPPKPDYLRVKIWRRLHSLGAVAIKNSVYALPRTGQCHEDFQWVLREIVAGGGEGMVCEAHLVDGLSSGEVQQLFQKSRQQDYAVIHKEAMKLLKAGSRKRAHDGSPPGLMTQVSRLKRRLSEVGAIDFFEASGRIEAERAIARLESAARGNRDKPRRERKSQSSNKLGQYKGRTWVTRKGIHVDRMASAWLIRRFIDADARFKFVSPEGYRPLEGELRFDMFEAEFTHEGDKCTFEVLRERSELTDRALRPIGEIVHDIDLKDGKFGRQEVPGIARVIAGIAMAYKEDERRLERGAAVFEDLYQYFSKHRETKTF